MAKDKNIFWLIFLFLAAVGARIIAAWDNEIFADGCGYVMHAWSIAQGRLSTPYWMSGIDHYYPPFYPLVIYLFHFVTGSYPWAAKLVSVFCSGLLVILAYFLGKKIFDARVGLFAAAFLVFQPLFFEVGINAYSEPLFLVLICLSMLWAWQMLEQKKPHQAFLAGMFLGLAYLTRGQALAGLASLVLVLLWFALVQKKFGFRQFARFLLLVLLGFYLLALPYDLYCWKKEKLWGLRFRIEFFKKGYQFDNQLEWFIRERTLTRQGDQFLTLQQARANSPLQFIRTNPAAYRNWLRADFKYVFSKKFLWNNLVTYLLCLSGLFLILGLVLGWQPRLSNFSAHAYLFLWFFPLLIIIPLSVSVIDRYFLPLVLSLAVWFGCGMELLSSKISALARERFKIKSAHLDGAVAAILLLATIYPHSQIREALKVKNIYAQQDEVNWLKEMTGNADREIILASQPYSAMYSGNYWYMLPIDNVNRTAIYVRAQKADFLLADSVFYDWTKSPSDYADVFLSPFSKPGLKYLGSFWFGKDQQHVQKTIYKVEPGHASTALRPNIILISIDTLRADHLSGYGYQRNTSPNLDRIAAEGVRFERVISQSPKTAPSHMTMFTSLYPEIHEVRHLYDDPTKIYPLSRAWTTLPEILSRHGYRTAAFTGGGQMGKNFGFERGFEVFEENMLQLEWQDFDPVFKWLDQVKPGEPFFLFLHTYQVHDPYCPPPPYNKLYDPDYWGWIIDDYQKLQKLAVSERQFRALHNVFWGGAQNQVKGDELNLSLISPRDRDHMVALYDGEIKYTDEILGRFFEELRKQGRLGNGKTLLIITSDHGEEFREHGDFLHKRLYRETLEVPLIFYWPGGLPKGKVMKGQARLLDLAPTVLDLIGIEPPGQMQGVSLKSAIASQREVYLSAYSADPFIKQQRSLRTGAWMYYLDEAERIEGLYDKDKDEQEKFNLLFGSPRLTDSVRDQAKYLYDCVLNFNYYNLRHRLLLSDIERKAQPSPISPEQLETLKALGYVK